MEMGIADHQLDAFFDLATTSISGSKGTVEAKVLSKQCWMLHKRFDAGDLDESVPISCSQPGQQARMLTGLHPKVLMWSLPVQDIICAFTSKLRLASVCRPMCEMLMGRLPATAAEQAIRQLARFLTTSTMPSVTSEAAVLANSAGWMHPKLTAKLIIGPMLSRLESELEGVPSLAAPSRPLSKVRSNKCVHGVHKSWCRSSCLHI